MHILHIGYPKTGTTWLQNIYFPKLNVNFKGKAIYLNLEKNNKDFMDELHREINSLNILMKQSKNLEKISLRDQSKEYKLISSEGLLGNIWWGMRDMENNINIIKRRFGSNTKIFVTIRSQLTMIESLYKQYILEGGKLNFKNFLDLNNQLYINLDLNTLKYYEIYSYLIDHFGNDNVLFLPFELIHQDLKLFNKKFLNFSGLEAPSELISTLDRSSIRTGFSINECLYRRYFNKILRTSMSPENLFKSSYNAEKQVSKLTKAISFDGLCKIISKLDELLIKRKLLNNQTFNLFKNLYNEDNKYLSNEINIDLHKLNYP